jgi:hypothetical protein
MREPTTLFLGRPLGLGVDVDVDGAGVPILGWVFLKKRENREKISFFQ